MDERQKELFWEIIQCGISNCLCEAGRCHCLAIDQTEQGVDSFQVPEPWNGDIANAKVVMVSINPGLTPTEMPEEQFKAIIDRARAMWPDARCAPHGQGYLAQTTHLQGDVYRRLVIYRRTPRVAVYGQCYADARKVLGSRLSEELSNHGQYVINIPKKIAEGDEAVWFGVSLKTEANNWAECQDAVLDMAKKVWELLNKWGAWGDPNQLRAALQIGTDEI